MLDSSISTVLKRNLDCVKQEIKDVAQGRCITLVCVTKYVNHEIAAALIDVGADSLGENRIIEGAQKLEAIRQSGRKFVAHHIGSVQSNKAQKIPVNFEWCQSLCNTKVAEILEKYCAVSDCRLNATIELNIGSEPQKDGVAPEEIDQLVDFVFENCPHLNIHGLMCIQPVSDEVETRRYFSRMRKLFDDFSTKYRGAITTWDTLSMGMSADFIWAIEEGATMVRVGSRLYNGIEGFSGHR